MNINFRFLPFAAAAMLAVAPVTTSAQSSHHEKTVGVTLGYVSRNQSAIAGIDFTYRFSQHLRFAPEILYAFQHHSEDALIANVDFHVPFQVSPRCDIYPLVGLNYTGWTFHHSRSAEQELLDVTTRSTHFGLNFGGGINANISSTMSVGFEARWAWVKNYNTALLSAKIAYRF
jgi:opacity protein-like surface antigen